MARIPAGTKRRRRLATCAVILTVLTVACSADPLGGQSTVISFIPPEPALGGDGLPVLNPNQILARTPVPVEGEFNLEANGCWTADLGDGFTRVVVFPVGFEKPSDNGAAMRGADGTIITDDMLFDGSGAVSPVSTLPGYPDGFWGNYVSFCDPNALEVLVLSEVGAAFAPDTLEADELVDLVRHADLTESWPCGIGFAISDRQQRVAVQLYATDSDLATESPIALPSAGWTADLVVGNHLMSNHCNDAIETWTADRRETARWDIVDGVLDFAPRSNDACSGANPVTGILRNAVVDSPGGPIVLPDLHVVNRAFGCFAG